jgi:D-alanyl-D-alanine carboxypeptidase
MRRKKVSAFLVPLAFVARALLAEDGIPAETRAAIDKAVRDALAKTGAPSASVAIVKDGKIAYVKAYGSARLEPPAAPATPAMRYSIGSVSKQFTSTAVLLLAEEGKLSLDDRLVRWLPDLTRAGDVTIRQLLSMTAGYQDYWPQDYVMPRMKQPVTAREIVDGWAKKPLDFTPGTKWQYSNTNYVLAGLIVEKASGMPLLDFLEKRVFGPLGMTTVVNTDAAPLGPEDAAGYQRFALGPPRPAPKEGKGWLFAAGELSMTAEDLARWDVSLIDRTVMKPASYRDLETDVRLENGVGSRYGLGVGLALVDGRRLVSHGGEVSGFTARNDVYPDERAAVVVLVNLDATGVTTDIAKKIGSSLFATSDGGTNQAVEQAKKILEGLRLGKLDRTLFTSNASAYFSEQAIKDFAASLGPLGKLQEFTQKSRSLRGGMTLRRLTAKFAKKTLSVSTLEMPDGKLEQFMVAAEE